MRLKHIIFTFFILTGCVKPTYIEGPELIVGSIEKVTIESLENRTKTNVIKDKDSIKKVEYLFSKYRWQKNNGRKFIPSYKFIIITKDRKLVNYWLGANSSLNEFPCYKLCSGWWVIPSDVENKPNGKIYKSLSASSQMALVADLLGNIWNQPNKAPQPTLKFPQ